MHEAHVRELREKGFRSVGLGSAHTQGDDTEDVQDLTGSPQIESQETEEGTLVNHPGVQLGGD
eukprot:9831735-Heterocapsa_arctica.AAC.1